MRLSGTRTEAKSMNPTQNDLPAPPVGLPVPGPATGGTPLGLAAKWWCIGVAASGGGALAGLMLAAIGAEPCSGILCGLEDVLRWVLYGWGFGVFAAAVNAASIEGPTSNKTVGLIAVVAGVLTLPLMLILGS